MTCSCSTTRLPSDCRRPSSTFATKQSRSIPSSMVAFSGRAWSASMARCLSVSVGMTQLTIAGRNQEGGSGRLAPSRPALSCTRSSRRRHQRAALRAQRRVGHSLGPRRPPLPRTPAPGTSLPYSGRCSTGSTTVGGFSAVVRQPGPLLVFLNEIIHQSLGCPKVRVHQTSQDRWEHDEALKRCSSQHPQSPDGWDTPLGRLRPAKSVINQEQLQIWEDLDGVHENQVIER